MKKKKKENETMLITYNHDRQAILNEESWVYTDSLNIAKTIGVENKEFNRKLKQVLQEYDLEDGEKTPPSTESEEFIYNNTDFAYSICYYLNTQNKLQPYYKLSKDLVTLVMFKFKSDKAREFQKLYIAKFNSMEKELQWYRCRYLGIVTRNSITDAIHENYIQEYNGKNIYVDFTDLVYETLYGLKAWQIRSVNSSKFSSKSSKSKNIRPWLKDEDIKLVEDLEKEICTLIKFNLTYEQIKDMLNKRYTTIYNLILLDEKRD
ncbi:hypothetical protein DVV91_10260 [Clostridium botulinum]|uniref:Rha family transcriptional regulator n=1 Tax=Clostridium botulinum TaxID=1491 RepID=UPI001966FB45|nr:Rha family transcriptional regulator [Clostridium botulinum]MBN1074725.1 hypothetical protein [Clostridium botulinum]